MSDTTAESARWLHVEKGLSINECSRQLGITPSAVHNALRRAGVGAPKDRKAAARMRVTHGHVASAGHDHSRNPILIQQRDPCFGCGIPLDRHDELGCKRWRPGL
jgi:hypothetical protein